MKAASWLTHGAIYSKLSYITWATYLRNGATHSGLDHLTTINSQNEAHTETPPGRYDQGNL